MDAAKTVTATFSQFITVTVPNGVGTLDQGTTYTIRWNYAGNPGSNVKIELLKGGVPTRTIANKTSRGSGGSGSYNWKVPNNQAIDRTTPSGLRAHQIATTQTPVIRISHSVVIRD